MSVYGIVKYAYRRLVPKALRRAIFLALPSPLEKLRRRFIRTLEKSARHDEIYDADYYMQIVDSHMANSCEVIAESIINAFSPKSVVDVGCGTGLLLLAFQKHGISCKGLEYSNAAIDICCRRGLKVTRLDLEQDAALPDLRSDVAISTEVAEHLPENRSDHFVDILCTVADTVVLTAAEPIPTTFGTDHVNEQPNEYWIRKFSSRGFDYDKSLSRKWRVEWPERKVAAFYASTVMVFNRAR